MILVVVFQSMAKQTMDSAPPSEGVALKKRKMWSHQVILHSSVCLSVFLSLHVCLSFSNRLCLPPSLSLPLSVCLCLSPLPLSVCLPLSVSVSASPPLSLSPSPLSPPSTYHTLYSHTFLLSLVLPAFCIRVFLLSQKRNTKERREGNEVKKRWENIALTCFSDALK